MKTSSLVEDVRSREVAYGKLVFWWLGQHSYILKTACHVLLLDPYLSPSPKRLMQSPLKASDPLDADLVTGSHDHGDHIDHGALPEIMNASPCASLLVPRVALAALKAEGLDMARVAAMDDGEAFERDGLKATALKAAHEFLDRDSTLGHPYLGFVFETDGVCVYHSGDTCLYEGLHESLRRWSLDAAFLPINGRDAKRLKAGCIGNMTYQEAVDLAGSVRLKAAVPSHFGMFAFNNEAPSLFKEYLEFKHPGVRCVLPELGKAVEIAGS